MKRANILKRTMAVTCAAAVIAAYTPMGFAGEISEATDTSGQVAITSSQDAAAGSSDVDTAKGGISEGASEGEDASGNSDVTAGQEAGADQGMAAEGDQAAGADTDAKVEGQAEGGAQNDGDAAADAGTDGDSGAEEGPDAGNPTDGTAGNEPDAKEALKDGLEEFANKVLNTVDKEVTPLEDSVDNMADILSAKLLAVPVQKAEDVKVLFSAIAPGKNRPEDINGSASGYNEIKVVKSIKNPEETDGIICSDTKKNDGAVEAYLKDRFGDELAEIEKTVIGKKVDVKGQDMTIKGIDWFVVKMNSSWGQPIHVDGEYIYEEEGILPENEVDVLFSALTPGIERPANPYGSATATDTIKKPYDEIKVLASVRNPEETGYILSNDTAEDSNVVEAYLKERFGDTLKKVEKERIGKIVNVNGVPKRISGIDWYVVKNLSNKKDSHPIHVDGEYIYEDLEFNEDALIKFFMLKDGYKKSDETKDWTGKVAEVTVKTKEYFHNYINNNTYADETKDQGITDKVEEFLTEKIGINLEDITKKVLENTALNTNNAIGIDWYLVKSVVGANETSFHVDGVFRPKKDETGEKKPENKEPAQGGGSTEVDQPKADPTDKPSVDPADKPAVKPADQPGKEEPADKPAKNHSSKKNQTTVIQENKIPAADAETVKGAPAESNSDQPAANEEPAKTENVEDQQGQVATSLPGIRLASVNKNSAAPEAAQTGDNQESILEGGVPLADAETLVPTDGNKAEKTDTEEKGGVGTPIALALGAAAAAIGATLSLRKKKFSK